MPIVNWSENVSSPKLTTPYQRYTWTRQRTGRKQSRPVDKSIVLPYTHHSSEVLRFQTGGGGAVWPVQGSAESDTLQQCMVSGGEGSAQLAAAVQKATNRAYSRLRGKARPNEAQLGTSLAELGESIAMIVTRAKQLGKAYKALRKGNFRAFVRALKVRPKERHQKTKWTRPKDASSLWLEYWLGWAPMIGDIYSAAAVLSAPIPEPIKISGSAKEPWQHLFWSHGGAKGTSTRCKHVLSGEARVRMVAEIEVVNPNLVLASQLGLLNPLAILWELVPFSFIINWFYNLGLYLGSLTDFVGLLVKNSCTTVRRLGKYSQTYQTRIGFSSWQYAYYDSTRQSTVRSLGLSSPIPVWSLPSRLSVTRAATAISLLTAIFTKG